MRIEIERGRGRKKRGKCARQENKVSRRKQDAGRITVCKKRWLGRGGGGA